MPRPKDWIVYVDKKGKTRAVPAITITGYRQGDSIEAEGNKVIGLVSSGNEFDAVKYGDEVLR